MRRLIQIVVLCALLGNSADATQRLIVRSTLGQSLLNLTCGLLGCSVIEGLGDPTGQLFLLGVPDLANLTATIQALLSFTGIIDLEIDDVASVLQDAPPIPQSLYDTTPVSYYGTTVWEGYVNQPAAQIVGISSAQSTYGVSGAGIVAVIDTGVDPNQPVLRPVLAPGYDFTRNTQGGSELPDITQTVIPIVTGVQPGYVNGYSAAALDESTVSVVDGQSYTAFGHGTMVSGIIHLVAPTAHIMPLKAFQATGKGYTSDILRAIYWAVRQNARVINMSFSAPQPSFEMQLAINYAMGAGVICVASAGNDSSSTAVYPAAYKNMIAVASTDNNDVRSTFSNYGSWVWMAAPGEGIITTYPWATYAATSGTSFSTPLVTGTVSLMLQARSGFSQTSAASAMGHAKLLGSDLGHGRLDIVQALEAAISGH